MGAGRRGEVIVVIQIDSAGLGTLIPCINNNERDCTQSSVRGTLRTMQKFLLIIGPFSELQSACALTMRVV